MVRPAPLALLALAWLGPASAARADLISDEEAQCRNATEGAACEANGKPGVCAKSTCSRNDYSGGPPPKSISVECLVCTPGAAPPAKAAEPAPTPANTEVKAATTPDAEAKPASGKGGCTTGAGGGPWLTGSIALGLVCLAIGRGRTRR